MTDRARLLSSTEGRLNASVLDEWSIVHFGFGVLAAAVGMKGWTFIAAATIYELAEYAHEYPAGSPLFGSKHPEWDVNVVSDLAVAFAGFCLAAWLQGRTMPDPRRAS